MQCHYYFRSILPSPLRSFDGGKIAAELGSIKVDRPEQPEGNFEIIFEILKLLNFEPASLLVVVKLSS